MIGLGLEGDFHRLPREALTHLGGKRQSAGLRAEVSFAAGPDGHLEKTFRQAAANASQIYFEANTVDPEHEKWHNGVAKWELDTIFAPENDRFLRKARFLSNETVMDRNCTGSEAPK